MDFIFGVVWDLFGVGLTIVMLALTFLVILTLHIAYVSKKNGDELERLGNKKFRIKHEKEVMRSSLIIFLVFVSVLIWFL